LLLEASRETGGSSLFSDGLIHARGAETFAELQQRVPLIDPVLGRVYVETYADTLAWLKGTGAFRQEAPGSVTSLPGENILFLGTTYAEKRQTFDYLDWLFAEAGGESITETKAVKLFTNATGRVIGIRAVNRDSTRLDI